MTTMRVLALALITLVLILAGPVAAQAVCDTATAPTTSVCNNSTNFSFVMPTTNTDGTPLNDFGSVRAIFGTMTPLCTPQGLPVTGATVRSLGPMGQPITPLPNTTVRATLGTLNMPNGLQRLAFQILDATGSSSACSAEVQFTLDNSVPNTATSVKVGL
jgi:hypothetical protein